MNDSSILISIYFYAELSVRFKTHMDTFIWIILRGQFGSTCEEKSHYLQDDVLN